MTDRTTSFGARRRSQLRAILIAIAILALLYLFLFSIKFMETSFQSFGEGRGKDWLAVADNPFVGLMVGILVTGIVQSSSFTTATIIGMVASGALGLASAIPMIMGANIGTTVTNLLVAIGHVPRREEFRRAYSAAVVHDFFNLLAVAVLFPIEMATGYLRKTASFIAESLVNVHAPPREKLMDKILTPPVNALRKLVVESLQDGSEIVAGIVCLVIALGFLIIALTLFVKVIRVALFGRVESVFVRFGFKRPLVSMFLGLFITAIVQSSSVTTSLMVPLAGAGLLTLEQVFPFMLGANVGTTVTALLASLVAGRDPALHAAGVTVALAHLLFNVTGIVIFYPIRFFREIPLRLARLLGEVVYRRKYIAPLFVLVVFLVMPLLCIWLWKAIR